MSQSGLFSCRIWFYDESLYVVECWSDELIPMNLDQCGTAEWAKTHLQECHDAAGLREILGVPAEGDWQVFFKGKMIAYKPSYPSFEYDEEFDLIGEVQKAEIPEQYADAMFYPDDGPDPINMTGWE